MTQIALATSSEQSHRLNQWNLSLAGPLSRLFALGRASLVGWATIDQALAQEQWALTAPDKEENALLALLCNHDLLWKDPIGNVYRTGLEEPLAPEIQTLCLRLVEKGCSPTHAPEALGGLTALDLAVAHNAHRLVRAHATPHWYADRTIDGLPWLHAAARQGCLEVMEVLLDQGVDPNLRAPDGTTALFHASNPDTVERLRRRAADPSLLDHAGLDAQSYWQSHRHATVDRVAGLKKALGPVKPTSGDAVMPQFLALVQSCPPGQLKKEIKRLKMRGNEWHEGQNVVSGYLASVVRSFGSTSLSDAPERRLRQVFEWEAALQEASSEQLAKLSACAVIARLPELARGFEQRLAPEHRAQALGRGWCDVIADIQLQQSRRELIAKHIMGSDLPLSTRATIAVATFDQDVSYPSSKLLEMFSTISDPVNTPGWETPGFALLLLRLCAAPTSINPTPAAGPNLTERAQLQLREVVLERARQGVPFAAALQDFRPYKPTPALLHFLDQLAAAASGMQLDRETRPAPSKPRASRF